MKDLGSQKTQLKEADKYILKNLIAKYLYMLVKLRIQIYKNL